GRGKGRGGGETGVLNQRRGSGKGSVRHKILDAIGVLSLLGHPLVGHLEASKAGHALHAALARAVLDAPDAWSLVTLPQLPVVTLPAPPAPAVPLAVQRR